MIDLNLTEEPLMKIKSVVVNDVKDVRIIEEDLYAEHLKPKECLIKNKVTFISPGTELSRVFGFKKGAAYPMRPGYCAVGRIIAKGEDVKDVQIDDLVLYSGYHASAQLFDQSKSDSGVLYKLDPRLSPQEGAVLKMCWISMNGILSADVKCFDTVVIFGLGILGQVLAILYQEMGVKVIGVDPVVSRCQLAQSMGLKIALSCPPKDQAEAIMTLTNKKGANIVVDASGFSPAIETAIQVAAKNAQVILLGSPRSDYMSNLTPVLNAIHMKNLHVIGALNKLFPFEEKEGSSLSIRRGLDYLTQLLIDKRIDAEKIISHTISPDQIMEAYEGLLNDKEVYTGVIINWD